MINLQNEFNKAVQAKNNIKAQFLNDIKETFERIKEAPPDQLNSLEQFIKFLIESPEPISSSELDALIISLDRENLSAPKKQLMLAS